MSKLISKSDWKTLASLLESTNEAGSIMREEANCCVFHQAIKQGAPKNILMLIAQRFPEALIQLDAERRYPIHIACAEGSHPGFILHCIEEYPFTISAKDVYGRTPLHLLCQSYKKKYSDNISCQHSGKYVNKDYGFETPAEKKMTIILWMIYRHDPATIALEDNDGVSALEYALESNVDIEFFRTLQNLTCDFNQNNSLQNRPPAAHAA